MPPSTNQIASCFDAPSITCVTEFFFYCSQKLKEEKAWMGVMDGRKEKIGNFKTESPGLFRGRGDNPKQC
jgi:hypothetical protein